MAVGGASALLMYTAAEEEASGTTADPTATATSIETAKEGIFASSDFASLDYDRTFIIISGTLVASGSSGIAQAPGAGSTQPSILMFYSSPQPAGSTLTLRDAKGAAILSFSPTKAYSSVAISSPPLSVGSSYSLYSGSVKLVEVKLAAMMTSLSESGVISA